MEALNAIEALDLEETNLVNRLEKVRSAKALLKELGFAVRVSDTNGVDKTEVKETSSNRQPVINFNEWDDKWSFKEKVRRLIIESNRFVHVTELTQLALSHGEPEHLPDSKSSLWERISANLSNLKKDKKDPIEKVQVNSRPSGAVWGLKEWKDGENIKPQYLYNKDVVK